MSLYKAYKVDDTLREDGIWLTDFEAPGIRVKVRDPSSVKARERRRQIEQSSQFVAAVKRAERNQTNLSPAVSDAISVEWFATGVVLDWDGVTDERGNSLPFTEANARKVFTDLPGFLNEIAVGATARSAFKREDDEALEKNSESA